MYWLNWYLVLPNLFALILLPAAVFCFFCRYCGTPFRWNYGACYVLCFILLYLLEVRFQIQGLLGLLAETLLLAGCGRFFLKKRWTEALPLSILILSVLNVSDGILCWMGYRVLLPFITAHPVFVYPSDTVREIFKVLLVLGFFAFLLNHFRQNIVNMNRQTMFYLMLPVFFISMVERILKLSVYGDTIQIDSRTGEIQYVNDIPHGEILFLHMTACLCLLAALYVCEKFMKNLYTEQQIKLLKQQTAGQEIYVQEALMREQRTRSFRHDIQNHLTVLSELLKNGQTDRAREYLKQLEQAASRLSCTVQTGNAAVDALLGSKFSAAEQKNIRVQWELNIPESSAVEDLDWCILLSNALDNALRACDDVPDEEKYISLQSRRKGSFFLLTVENSCDRNLKKVPADGTGLSNIRMVMERNRGFAENTVSEGVYRLRMFFGSLQQK